MINQLLKLGALLATGRFLKTRMKGVLGVLLVWVLLWFVHSEFVDYVELSGDTRYVLYASLTKLLLYALTITVYVWKVERKLWPKTGTTSVLLPAGKKPAAQANTPRPVRLAENDDGFDFLRDKRKLKDSSDQLLGKTDQG